MVVKIVAGKIYLTWSWGGQIEMTSSGARRLASILLALAEDADEGRTARKQL